MPVLAVLTLALLWACSPAYQTVDEELAESGAAVRITNFRREAVRVDGRPEWRMEAREAYLFLEGADSQSKIVCLEFRFRQFDSKGAPIGRLSAKRGEIDYENGRMELAGQVVFTQEGRTIRGAEMGYDMETKVLETDKPVVIEEDGGVTRCTRGMKVEDENKRQTCRGPAIVRVSREGDDEGEELGELFQ